MRMRDIPRRFVDDRLDELYLLEVHMFGATVQPIVGQVKVVRS